MKFELGKFYTVIHDSEKQKKMLTAICERFAGFNYELSNGAATSWHFAQELQEWIEPEKAGL